MNATDVNSLTADANYLYFLRDPFADPHSVRKINVDGSGLASPVNDNVGEATQLRSNATAFFMLAPQNVPTSILTLAKNATSSPIPIVTGRFRILSDARVHSCGKKRLSSGLWRANRHE